MLTLQDEGGIAREYPPPIAWFKDPAGNIGLTSAASKRTTNVR